MHPTTSMLRSSSVAGAPTCRQKHTVSLVQQNMFLSSSQKSQRSVQHVNNEPRRSPITAATQTEDAGPGKLISKVEIPAFIPRPDLSDQLLRWALIEIQEGGVANVGCPCKVTPHTHDGQLWGFTVSFMKDGESATDVRVAFDEEVTLKHEWVGRGADGFPMLEGNAEEIKGKNFEIRKLGEDSVSDQVKTSIKEFCKLLVGAINKYYAFGSCFVDDST